MHAAIRSDLEVWESLAQLLQNIDPLALHTKCVEVVDDVGLSVRWSDSTMPMLNCVALTDRISKEGQLCDRILLASEYLKTSRVAGYLWVFEELLDGSVLLDIDALAEAYGLMLIGRAVGLATSDMPDGIEPHANFSIREINDEASLRFYAEVIASSGASSLDATKIRHYGASATN